MIHKPQTIGQFFQRFPSDEVCLQHLFGVRFGQGFECPKCERASNWYRIKAERAFSCQWCGHHLHPTVGTPFAKSRTSLQLWFYAIFLFTTTRNGVAAKELQRQLGVTYKTAWRMADLIRKHMADVDGETPLGGLNKIVEIDETWVGGKVSGKGPAYVKNKTTVFGMMEKGGEVMTMVVPNRPKMTLEGHIIANVKPYTVIHTDDYSSYDALHEIDGFRHKRVDHSAGQYVAQDGTTVNRIEAFWAQLKRTIGGTHIHVSGKHLWKYAKEVEFRFNRRHRPASMMDDLLTTFGPLPTK